MRVTPTGGASAAIAWTAAIAFVWLVAEQRVEQGDATAPRAASAEANTRPPPPPLDAGVDWARVERAPDMAGAALAAYEP
jgi:hypothetical protein